MLEVGTFATPFPDDALVVEWRELLLDSEFATPFQTPAWTSQWWAHFGREKSPHWLTFREGGDLVGLYPLYKTAGPWRTLRAVGTGQSDYLHPLVRKGCLKQVGEAFSEHLSSLRDVDLADLHQLREGFAPIVGDAAPDAQATCLVLDLPASYDEYLKGLSKSLRFDCRRLDKDPFASGLARVREIGADEAEATVDSFFSLHAARWRKRGLPGAFATRRLKGFHKDVNAALADDGQLRMSVLELDGRCIGVLYAMQVADTRYFYQCGFDPEQKALSPGTLLVASAIRSAIEEGCTRFDFLRGDEPYKRRWNAQHSLRNMRYILPLNSGLGSVGRAVNHAGSKIEEKVRARLEGRGLLG